MVMAKKEKLLLIDGHSIVNRAFYGIPPLTNSSGLHTNAIMGFINIFLNAYKQFSPDYVLVAFDVKQKTFRHELYKEYKGNRKGMPEELHEQVPVLQDVLHAMGIKTVELPGYEADDIIGTFAGMADAAGAEAVILSGDRDLLQLATDKVMVSIPKTKSGGTEIENYYAADVKEKYGVSPEGFIEMKALMGDTSDNIPGIPGIGEKTASGIIQKFGTLENAYEHIDEVTPNRARENLREYIEQGRMSRVLAVINTNSPVPFEFKEGKIESYESMFNSDSYDIMKKLELNKLLSRFDFEKIDTPAAIEYEVKDISEFPCSLSSNSNGEQLSFFESPKQGKAGLFVDAGKNIAALTKDGKTTVYKGFNDNVRALIESGAELYCFGLKNILHTVDAEGKRSTSVHDIELMAYLLMPIAKSFSYDSVSKDYLGKLVPGTIELLGKKSLNASFDEAPENCFRLAAYASSTAIDAFPVLKEKLEEAGMWQLYTEIEMPLIYSLYNMEKRGIGVDRKALKDFSLQLQEMADTLQSEIYEEAGEEFNINSPSQLGTVLFEKLKLPAGKKTKTGYSTSAEILEKLADDFPVVTKILKYRQVTKLRSTYAEGLPEFISEDGRIHGTFNQTITATGRISSTEPNLQNIPIRSELGQEIRKAFAAKEGCVFVDADYSQIELRLLAHLSDDKNLIESYKSDVDIHRVTASKVFNTTLEEVTKQQRSNAKAVNFGIVYGISSFGLSQGLSINRKQAEQYIKQYFETYPGVKAYLDNTVKKAKIDGYVTTLFGRRRPIPELASSNFMQRSFGERVAMNSPIQGTAADIMKIAMINVDRALCDAGLEARVVLQIHDELLVECPVSEKEKVKEILYNEMKNAASLSVSLEVEANEGADWFEAH